MKAGKPQIIHVLANGKRVDSIEGHIVPVDNLAYRLIVDVAKEEKRKKLA